VPVLDALLDRAGITWRLLVKELSAFGIVGAACTVIDLGVFQLLYAHAGVGAVTARCISTVLSMTVGYFAHRHWSFSHRARTGLRREYLLFAAINGSTLLLSLAIVALVRYPLHQEHPLVLQVANVFSIGLGTVIRYLAYRRWVFLAPDHPAAPAPQPAPLDSAA
jgi:putative flippase GtrA